MAIVLLVLLTIVGPWRDTLRHDVSQRLPPGLQRRPSRSTTPCTRLRPRDQFGARLHPAANAIDGAVNTSWQTNAPDSGVGQSLCIRLGAVSNLDKIGFLNGDQDTPSSYLTEPRPEKIT